MEYVAGARQHYSNQYGGSGKRIFKLESNNNNLFGMKCMKGRCTNALGKVKGYSQFASVKELVNAYVTNLNIHPAYSSFRKSCDQLRKVDQKITSMAMIYKLKGYSTQGARYNNYLFAMYQDNQRLITTHVVLSARWRYLYPAYKMICRPDKLLPATITTLHYDGRDTS